MCACGCFFLAVVGAGLAYCALHGMWILFSVIVVVAVVVGWFGRKAADWRPAPKK